MVKRQKTLFRFYSSGVVDFTIKNAIEVKTLKDIENVIRSKGITFKHIEVEQYGRENRINWITYLITIDGRAIGYTNFKPE